VSTYFESYLTEAANRMFAVFFFVMARGGCWCSVLPSTVVQMAYFFRVRCRMCLADKVHVVVSNVVSNRHFPPLQEQINSVS
jgi:hypothetical protein